MRLFSRARRRKPWVRPSDKRSSATSASRWLKTKSSGIESSTSSALSCATVTVLSQNSDAGLANFWSNLRRDRWRLPDIVMLTERRRNTSRLPDVSRALYFWRFSRAYFCPLVTTRALTIPASLPITESCRQSPNSGNRCPERSRPASVARRQTMPLYCSTGLTSHNGSLYVTAVDGWRLDGNALVVVRWKPPYSPILQTCSFISSGEARRRSLETVKIVVTAVYS